MARRFFEGRESLTPLEPEEEPPCASAMAFSAFCAQVMGWVDDPKGKGEEVERINVAYIRLQHR